MQWLILKKMLSSTINFSSLSTTMPETLVYFPSEHTEPYHITCCADCSKLEICCFPVSFLLEHIDFLLSCYRFASVLHSSQFKQIGAICAVLLHSQHWNCLTRMNMMRKKSYLLSHRVNQHDLPERQVRELVGYLVILTLTCLIYNKKDDA